ncbi:cyclic di-GMP phosphodiesterase Gmr [Modestobacter sp. DSM 44400]|uniref:GGDEF domain-containing protein n=1 Tax=Modestobacter sp. DSM 44400 TaxID=1550230 RepID=UPI000899E367|nr:diguanylate cyclase [Modestobacter sp. DSM 44400]SDY11315.1 cyclic di-GMP phosphodiesterase Gmr [Modestobacter sp. DSM 44400]
MTSGDGWTSPEVALSRAFVEATRSLVCVVDGEGRILLANPALQRFTGRSPDELVGHRFWDVFVVPEHVLLAEDAVVRAMASGVAFPQEGDWLAADGERRRVAMQNDVLTDADGRPWGIACVGLDVTEQRRREEQLHLRAQTDLLTGLPNRRALFDVLGRMLDPPVGGSCGILFCDLDEFKSVNDEYGHAVGDALLTEVARRLLAVAESGDVVVRFGGDEFVLVCSHADDTRLRALAARVVDRVCAPVAGPDGPLAVGVSVGTAAARPGEGPDELISRADRAMYGAKTHQVRRHPRRPAPGGPPA